MLISRAIWFRKMLHFIVVGGNHRVQSPGTLPRFLGVDALDKILGKASSVCPRATVPLV